MYLYTNGVITDGGLFPSLLRSISVSAKSLTIVVTQNICVVFWLADEYTCRMTCYNEVDYLTFRDSLKIIAGRIPFNIQVLEYLLSTVCGMIYLSTMITSNHVY